MERFRTTLQQRDKKLHKSIRWDRWNPFFTPPWINIRWWLFLMLNFELEKLFESAGNFSAKVRFSGTVFWNWNCDIWLKLTMSKCTEPSYRQVFECYPVHTTFILSNVAAQLKLQQIPSFTSNYEFFSIFHWKFISVLLTWLNNLLSLKMCVQTVNCTVVCVSVCFALTAFGRNVVNISKKKNK